jgi:hypothetical protein
MQSNYAHPRVLMMKMMAQFWLLLSKRSHLNLTKGADDEDDGSVLAAAFKKVPPEPRENYQLPMGPKQEQGERMT